MITRHYKGSLELIFDEEKHLYVAREKNKETKCVGVTTALGVISKPQLVYWAANTAAEYIQNNLPLGKPLDELMLNKLVQGAKGAHRVKKSDAADYGTMLHGLIEDVAHRRKVNPVNPILQKGVTDFKQWVVDNHVIFRGCERKVVSRKKKFAGTLDLLLNINGKNAIADIKTSNGIYDEYFLQLAAYLYALYEEFPDVKIEDAIIIRCGKDGSFEIKSFSDIVAQKQKVFKDFQEFYKKCSTIFLSALDLHNGLQLLKGK